MKRRINKPQSILALATLLAWAALCLTACINQGFDPDDNSPHAHLTLLQLGNVTIADAQTAADATTRAATTEDATGFTGIRKTTFVAGDKLTLSFFAAGTSTHPYAEKDATYNGTAWTLGKRIFTAAGTIIRATYSPVAPPAGHTYKDDLTSEDIELPVDGSATTIPMKHLHAMIEVTPPAGKTVSNVVVKATPTGTSTAESLATAQEVTTVSGQDAPIYRTIAKQGTVTSITLTIDGNAYTATLATALTVEGNKRYPIALSMKENELIATVGTASLGWGAGTDMALDYTRTIATPEDLAQFAYDVNNNLNNAPNAIVLQTADIDLSQLKPAAEVNAAKGTNYTYTATAEQWTPIGYNGANVIFMGTYNGDGHTISNLKYNGSETNIGLFGCAANAVLTGIHIRDCELFGTSETGNGDLNVGALVAMCVKSTVSLCSATGTISAKARVVHAGGLFGDCGNSGTTITRCSTSVNITMEATNGQMTSSIGGITGKDSGSTYAACSASGTLTRNGTIGQAYGITNRVLTSNPTIITNAYFCQFTGTIVGAATGEKAVFGNIHTVVGCYATGNYDTFATIASGGDGAKDNAITGTLTNALAGVTAGVAENEVYGKLTATSGYMTPADALIKTLHWNQADGYTLTPVERQWKASGAWKEDLSGGLPTLNLFYEGETTVP